MGVFNNAIPRQLNRNRTNSVLAQQPANDYYVDDIFDPIFNYNVKEGLKQKYGDNPIITPIAGYAELLDNTLLGQEDKWGILGPGMGILSGFGRSMDKVGDPIIGGVTEGLKTLTGQRAENPLTNIFVDDEDYTGTRLLAAMGNSMSKMSGMPKLEEKDFSGLWNVAGLGYDLAFDPSILGGSLRRAFAPGVSKTAKSSDLLANLGNAGLKSSVGEMGQLLSNYDDVMAKISIDVTAPGLRPAIKALRNKMNATIGTSSSRAYADVDIPNYGAEDLSDFPGTPKTPDVTPSAPFTAPQANRDADVDAILNYETPIEEAMLAQERLRKDVVFTETVKMNQEIETAIAAKEEALKLAKATENVSLIENPMHKKLPVKQEVYYSDFPEADVTRWKQRAAALETDIPERAKKISKDKEALAEFKNLYDEQRNTKEKLNSYALKQGLEETSLGKKLGTTSLNTIKDEAYENLVSRYEEATDFDKLKKNTWDDLDSNVDEIMDISELSEEAINEQVSQKSQELLTELSEDIREQVMQGIEDGASGLTNKEYIDINNLNFDPEAIIGGYISPNEATNKNIYQHLGIDLTSLKNRDVLTKSSTRSPVSFSPSNVSYFDDTTKFAAANLSYAKIKNFLDTHKKIGTLNSFKDARTLKKALNESVALREMLQGSYLAYEDFVDMLVKVSFPKSTAGGTAAKFTEDSLDGYLKNVTDLTETVKNLSIKNSSPKPVIHPVSKFVKDAPYKKTLDKPFTELTPYEYKKITEPTTKYFENFKYKLEKLSKEQELINKENKNIELLNNLTSDTPLSPKRKLTPKEQMRIQAQRNREARGIVKSIPSAEDVLTTYRPNVLPDFKNPDIQEIENLLNEIKPTGEFTDVVLSLTSNKASRNKFIQVLDEISSNKVLSEKQKKYMFSKTFFDGIVVKETITPAPKINHELRNAVLGMYEKHGDAFLTDPVSYFPKEALTLTAVRNMRPDIPIADIGADSIEGLIQDTVKKIVKDLNANITPTFGFDLQKLADDITENITNPINRKLGADNFLEPYKKAADLRGNWLSPDLGSMNTSSIHADLNKMLKQLRAKGPISAKEIQEFTEKYPFLQVKITGDTNLTYDIPDFIEKFNKFEKEILPLVEKQVDRGYNPFIKSAKNPVYVQTSKDPAMMAFVNEVIKDNFYSNKVIKDTNKMHPLVERKFREINDVAGIENTPENLLALQKQYKEKPVYFGYVDTSGLNLENPGQKLKYFVENNYFNPKRRVLTTVDFKYNTGEVLLKNAKEKISVQNEDSVVESLKDTLQQIPEETFIEIVSGPPISIAEEKANAVIKELIPEAPVIQAADEIIPPERIPLNTPPPEGGSGNIPGGSDNFGDEFIPKKQRRFFEIIRDAVSVSGKNRIGHMGTTRNKNVQGIFDMLSNLKAEKKLPSPDVVRKHIIAQTMLKGDTTKGSDLIFELAAAKGRLSATTRGMGPDALKHFQDSLRHNVDEINRVMGADVVSIFKTADYHKTPSFGITWNKNNINILKSKWDNLKNAKLVDIEWSPKYSYADLPDDIKQVMTAPGYGTLESIFKQVRTEYGEFAKLAGVKADDLDYAVKHVMRTDSQVADFFSKNYYKDMNLKDLDEISNNLVNNDFFRTKLRGAFGVRNAERSIRGDITPFLDPSMEMFNTNVHEIVRSTFTKGFLEDSNVQAVVDLFKNDNFNISSYAKTPDDLKKILYATDVNGDLSGNIDNLMLVSPKYDNSGRITGFLRHDKLSDWGLEQALKSKEAILVPTHVIAPLDRILRKEAKLSNKAFAAINKYLTIPFKFGVLTNPGFILGNIGDAGLKQITTNAQKYGTTVPEEFTNMLMSVREAMYLNNAFDDVYRKFITDLKLHGVKVTPVQEISSFMASSKSTRKKFMDFIETSEHLTDKERGTAKLWDLVNSSHAAATFNSNLHDFEDVAKAMNTSKYNQPSNVVERVLKGKGKYVGSDISTWGIAVNNPIQKGVMDASESIEHYARSSSILNDLKHKGLDRNRLIELLNLSPDAENKLRDDLMVNISEAVNTMHHSNFSYEDVPDFMDNVSNFIPFPTFFLKNFSYWLQMLVDNPQYLDHAISVQEGLWSGRNTDKDEFIAGAKGRGAIPIGGNKKGGLEGFFKGIYKPAPLNSMFGAFNMLNSPGADIFYRSHPLISGAAAAASKVSPAVKNTLKGVVGTENIKYRPYSTDMYEKNIGIDNPEFNPLAYQAHRINPFERGINSALRAPAKIKQGEAQLSDFSSSVFQPTF